MFFPLFSRFGHKFFHLAESIGEFSVCSLQCGFRIDIKMSREINNREKKIPNLFLDSRFIFFLYGAPDFVNLFANLPEKRRYISLRPVEADMSRLRLYPKSSRKWRKA